MRSPYRCSPCTASTPARTAPRRGGISRRGRTAPHSCSSAWRTSRWAVWRSWWNVSGVQRTGTAVSDGSGMGSCERPHGVWGYGVHVRYMRGELMPALLLLGCEGRTTALLVSAWRTSRWVRGVQHWHACGMHATCWRVFECHCQCTTFLPLSAVYLCVLNGASCRHGQRRSRQAPVQPVRVVVLTLGCTPTPTPTRLPP